MSTAHGQAVVRARGAVWWVGVGAHSFAWKKLIPTPPPKEPNAFKRPREGRGALSFPSPSPLDTLQVFAIFCHHLIFH